MNSELAALAARLTAEYEPGGEGPSSCASQASRGPGGNREGAQRGEAVRRARSVRRSSQGATSRGEWASRAKRSPAARADPNANQGHGPGGARRRCSPAPARGRSKSPSGGSPCGATAGATCFRRRTCGSGAGRSRSTGACTPRNAAPSDLDEQPAAVRGVQQGHVGTDWPCRSKA
jgi:hypothetical protein